MAEVDLFVDRVPGDFVPAVLLALLENTRLRENHPEEEVARDDFDRDYFRYVLWQAPGGAVHAWFGEFTKLGQIIPKLVQHEQMDDEEWALLLREAKGFLAEFLERRAQLIEECVLDHLIDIGRNSEQQRDRVRAAATERLLEILRSVWIPAIKLFYSENGPFWMRRIADQADQGENRVIDRMTAAFHTWPAARQVALSISELIATYKSVQVELYFELQKRRQLKGERPGATREEIARRVDWYCNPFENYFDRYLTEAAQGLDKSGDHGLRNALGILALVYGLSREPALPADHLLSSSWFWRPAAAPVARRFFFSVLSPTQSQQMLRRAWGFGLERSRIFWDSVLWSTETPEIIPHLVVLLELEDESRRLDVVGPLRAAASKWNPLDRALRYLVEAAEERLERLGPEPFKISDTRADLWALSGIIPVIKWIVNAMPEGSGGQWVPRLRAIVNSLDLQWPDPPQFAWQGVNPLDRPNMSWLPLRDGWSPFSALVQAEEYDHPGVVVRDALAGLVGTDGSPDEGLSVNVDEVARKLHLSSADLDQARRSAGQFTYLWDNEALRKVSYEFDVLALYPMGRRLVAKGVLSSEEGAWLDSG